jgi:hypothetical protein
MSTSNNTKAFTYIYLTRRDDDPRLRREMVELKAASLGIELVGEFIEYGPLPDSAHECPQFQNMATAIHEQRDIGAVIVPRPGQTHNRRLEMSIDFGLRALDVQLISATDTIIGTTPFGDLILATSATLHAAQNGHPCKRRRRMNDAA